MDGRWGSRQKNESSTGTEHTVTPLTTDDIPSIVQQVISTVQKDAPPDNRPLGSGMYVRIIELATYVCHYIHVFYILIDNSVAKCHIIVQCIAK